jgi:hypothetical protein
MNTKKGFILMTTLFLSFVLLAIVIVLTKDAFFQMSSSVAFNSRNEALMIAEAGANKAIFFLENTLDPNTGKEPTQSEWNSEMSNLKIGTGTCNVNAWNNLGSTDTNGSDVPGFSDNSSTRVPAGCILVKSVGKTKNGYTKTVTTLLTYQAISQVLYSSGPIRLGGDGNMSVKLDSLTGFQPRVHSNNTGSKSIYIDSAVSLDAQTSEFSTATSSLEETSKNKITSSGGTVVENSIYDEQKYKYRVDIKAILNNAPSDAYEFGSELAKINSSGELDKTLAKLKFADSLLGKIYSTVTGVNADDYVEMDIDIDKVKSVDNVKFTGTLKGDGNGKIWASTSINVYYGAGKTDPDPNNPVTIWLSSGDGFNNCATDGLSWDSANNKLILEKGKYISKDSPTCLGALKLQNLSLKISDNSELYINKQLNLSNVDVTCGDGVKIVSGDNIALVHSAFEIGNDDDDTNKVDIMTDKSFIAIMNRNPSGGKNYIKGAIYAGNGLIINGSDGTSLDIEGVVLSQGNLSIYNNLLTPDTSTDFSCAFHYNPYMASQYLQFNLNKGELQLQPLFWEVK